MIKNTLPIFPKAFFPIHNQEQELLNTFLREFNTFLSKETLKYIPRWNKNYIDQLCLEIHLLYKYLPQQFDEKGAIQELINALAFLERYIKGDERTQVLVGCVKKIMMTLGAMFYYTKNDELKKDCKRLLEDCMRKADELVPNIFTEEPMALFLAQLYQQESSSTALLGPYYLTCANYWKGQFVPPQEKIVVEEAKRVSLINSNSTDTFENFNNINNNNNINELLTVLKNEKSLKNQDIMQNKPAVPPQNTHFLVRWPV